MEISKINFSTCTIPSKEKNRTVKTELPAAKETNLNGLNILGIYNKGQVSNTLITSQNSFTGNIDEIDEDEDADYISRIIDLDEINNTTTEPNGNTGKLQKAIKSALPHLDRHTLIVVGDNDNENTARALQKVINNEVFDNYGYITTILKITDDRIPNPIFIGQNIGEDNSYLINGEGCHIYNDNDEYMETTLTTSVIEANSADKLEFTDKLWPVKLIPSETIDSELKYCQKIDTNDFIMRTLAESELLEPSSFIKSDKIFTTSNTKNHGNIKHPNFSDVGGQKKAIQILEEEVLFPLIYPEAFGHIMNKGAILQGPPGTGKTHIAKSLANEIYNKTGLDVKFVDIDGTSLTTSGVGDTEASWRKLFAEAKKNEPCLIFIDEFESVAQKRDGSSNARFDDKTVNQILTLMSDLEKSDKKVFVLAATNQLELLDPAITRDGRFGRIISVDLPDKEGCKEVFDIHLKKKNVSDNIDKEKITQKMYDMKLSNAQIAGTIERAERIAYRRAGIYDSMRNGTYKKSDLKNAQIIEEDLIEGLRDVQEKNKQIKSGRTIIKGFRP